MNKLSLYLQSNWIKYFLIVIFTIVFWLILYSDIDNVKYDESIRILYIGNDLDKEKLEENISSNITAITNQDLKYVSIMSYCEENQIYEYMRNKVYSVDIIIVSEEYYNDEFISQIFVPLTTNLKQNFNGIDLVEINDYSYGLKICEDSIFYNFYNKEEQVYLFISQFSLNLGNAYGYGKVENDSAISIAKYITGVN